MNLSARRDDPSAGDVLNFVALLSAFLTSGRDSRSLLPDVLEMILRNLHLKHILLFTARTRAAGKTLVLANFESSTRQTLQRYEIPFGTGVSGTVAESASPLEEMNPRPELFSGERQLEGIIGDSPFSAHPLIGEDEVLGVLLFVENSEGNGRELYRVIANTLSSYLLLVKSRTDSRHSRRKFALLNNYRRLFSGSFDLKPVLSVFMNMTAGILGAEVGVCILLDRETGNPWEEINWGLSYSDVLGMKDKSGLTLAEKVRSVHGVLRSSVRDGGGPLFSLQGGGGSVINSYIAGGLYSKDKMIGFLLLANKSTDPLDDMNSAFSSDDEELFEIVLEQARVFIENYLLYGRVMEMNALNQRILENIDSGVFTLDMKGYISSSNTRFRQMFGFQDLSPEGSHISAVFPIPGLEMHNFTSNKALPVSDYHNFEYEQNGIRWVLSLMVSPMKNEAGQISGYVATVVDRTEHIAMERQMRRTDKLAALGELSAGLAHEIKNPLTAIKGFAQLLPKRFGDEKFLHKFSTMLTNELMRIDELTERLLTFARPNVGGMREIAIQDLVEDTILLAKYQLEKADIRYIVEGCEPPPGVIGSPSRLSQVFLNIIINGMHAMEKGGLLTVRIFRSPYLIPDRGTVDAVVVDFVDTGVGIDEDRIDSIFNPFFTTRESGTGLGLAISYRIIEEHSGVIEVKSKKGQGTRMRVVLPEMEPDNET